MSLPQHVFVIRGLLLFLVISHFASADNRIHLDNSVLKVNYINYRALHRYECHDSLFKYPSEEINLLHGSHISYPNAEYLALFIRLFL
jgi:hypothetical protein